MVDSHCHIDLYPNPENMLKQIEKSGIFTIGVTYIPSHYKIAKRYVRKLNYIRMAVGLHPLLTNKHTQNELQLFQKCVGETSYIGEIGLDGSKEGRAKLSLQIDSFYYVLKLINDRPRFISVHSRDAEEQVLNGLIENNIINAVFHWYSGPRELIDDIIEHNYWFSINPAMIRSSRGQKLIKYIPKERILTESDGPFIKIGNRVVQPQDVNKCIEYLAIKWGMSIYETEEQIKTNFFKIIDSIKAGRFSK